MALKQDWAIDETIKQNYLDKCKLFVESDEAFANFKRDKDYGMILEGNEHEVGLVAENYLVQRGGWPFFKMYEQQFKENDLYGNPEMYEWSVSPATLRYVNSLWEIRHLLGDFKPRRILEIGGGYGGLCKTLSVVYDFDDHTDKDIPEAEALFSKYIGKFEGLRHKVNHEISGDYDLFIADSSLSECDAATQLAYAEIASKCSYVYLVYNTLHKQGNKETYAKIMSMFKGYHIMRTPEINTNQGYQHFTNTILLRKDGEFI